MLIRRIAVLTLAATLVVACSSDPAATPTTTAPGTTAPTTTAAAPPSTDAALAAATFTVQPGTEQIAVLGAKPGTELHVEQSGKEVAKGTVDAQGSLLFRSLAPGDHYTVASDTEAAAPVTVASPTDVPPASLYENQKLLPAGGFGYITTRDGTTLSANVILPGPADKGPYPTVLEYSGYSPSDPGSAQLAAIYTAQGFAYVGVNMRGTGCSGGSYRFFETVQSLDGYDAIEAVAAQPWVKDHQVGMVGISYPGISQLFVAATQPPHLNSITPLSVLDDSYRATLYPGGILNTGFAVNWTQQRMDDAKPFGEGWTKQMADKGDTRCADNQKLRLQNPDLISEIKANPYYSNPLGDSLAPITFVDRIKVPVFIAGAWQDEQTGGHFPVMLSHFTSSPHVYITLVNGLHTESLTPPVARRYMEFLQLYVGKKVPDLSAGPTIASSLGAVIWGVKDFGPFPNRFQGMTYAAALKKFESEPSVRILFEQGANPSFSPGTPEPNFTEEFPSWPIPTAKATTWWLTGKGVLSNSAPDAATPITAASSFTADPTKLPATFYTGSGNGVWRADVKYDWQPMPKGYGVGYTSAPLASSTIVAGSGSADLWVKSSAKDVDLQVTISEVRPDGKEIYVQSGWQRASQRALAPESTPTDPRHTNTKEDAADLPADGWTQVRVGIFPFAHRFQKGSRIRLTINAPGNARAIWQFVTLDNGQTVNIAENAPFPSKLVLSVLPDLKVTAPVPPACGSLRGEPCRTYTPADNGG